MRSASQRGSAPHGDSETQAKRRSAIFCVSLPSLSWCRHPAGRCWERGSKRSHRVVCEPALDVACITSTHVPWPEFSTRSHQTTRQAGKCVWPGEKGDRFSQSTRFSVKVHGKGGRLAISSLRSPPPLLRMHLDAFRQVPYISSLHGLLGCGGPANSPGIFKGKHLPVHGQPRVSILCISWLPPWPQLRRPRVARPLLVTGPQRALV